MYDLRWYQRAACDAVWQFLCSQQGNAVVTLPTGAGKSVVIAELCREAVEKYKGRVIVLAHRKELLQQNAEKIRALLPGFDVGIYSAGLRSRDTNHDILCGGIQSVHKRAAEFGARHLVVVDEAHLVPAGGEGMYRTFLGELASINTKLRLVGLTATPFRTSEGKICGRTNLFHHECYSAPLKKLIEEGWLCRLDNKPAVASVDTSGLHVRNGEFIPLECEALFSDAGKIRAACAEIVAATVGRRSVLVFCSGVRHAEQVAETIRSLACCDTGCVVGDTPDLERAGLLDRFRRGQLRYLTNCDVLTTGFDAPGIDAIAVLRATLSPGLFAQMVGRGLRTAANKADCLILDFGENIQRHGPLDSPEFGASKPSSGRGESGDAPQKVCPGCGEELPAATTECECGFLFPREIKHGTKADADGELLASAEPQTWNVVEVSWSRHVNKKTGKLPTLRCTYQCEPAEGGSGNLRFRPVSEWLCVEHDGYARTKFCLWWKACSLAPVPTTINEALELFERGACATPYELTTIRDGKFDRITARLLDERPTEWREAVAVADAFAEDVPF